MSMAAAQDIYRLSPMQTAMLFHALHSPQGVTAFNQLSCRLTGTLDIAAFRAAWERLIERHAVFRTSFRHRNLAEPLQVVHRAVEMPLVVLDWRGLSAEAQAEGWQALRDSDRSLGFSLDRAPLMRVTLARIGEDRHLLLWSHHHLLSDGWCLSLVMEEVFGAYGAAIGAIAPKDTPAPRFRDYIDWLERQDATAAETFWRRMLAGFEAVVPIAPPPPGHVHSAATERQSLSLDVETGRMLAKTMRTFGLTANSLVQGAWAILLARYTDQQDIVFGTTVAGRPTDIAGADRIIGLFINTIPLRVVVDARQIVVPFLKTIQARAAARSAFEHLPLSAIQRVSDVSPGQPLFESNLVFMNYPIDEGLARGAHGLDVDWIDIQDRSDVPLELQVTARETWLLEISYDPARYDANLISRMLGHLGRLLEGIAAAPMSQIGALDMLTTAERTTILGTFNDTIVPFDDTLSIVERFEQQVRKTPDRIMVSCDGVDWTAARLNARANQIASMLRTLAAPGRDDIVAVCAARSFDLMAAVIGIWKCGAAYVPIDPAYPNARIATILQDAAVRAVCVDASARPGCTGDVPTLSLASVAWRDDVPDPDHTIDPSTLAYVIYTSGSTGVPKGALLEHAGLVNHILAEAAELDIGPDSVMAQTASQCFDISVWQFFAGMVTGARTAIIPDSAIRDPRLLLDALQAERCSILELVPSQVQPLLDLAVDRRDAFGAVRALLATGEVIAPSLLDRWFALNPDIPVFNAYGPSEACDDVAQFRIDRPLVGSHVPVGRPLQNNRIYILDPELNLCPVGVTGELCVGGVGVGRGYLNRPEATAHSFLTDPYSRPPGGRLYRTGDLGAWTGEGLLIVHGRKDHQIKLNGHRIELGEIEHVLMSHPQVGTAVAAVHGVTDHQVLYAFITQASDAPVETAAVTATAASLLPSYMVPQQIVVLERMPLTPNGKINRKALVVPERHVRPDVPVEGLPQTPMQEALATIWRTALRLEDIGIDDNFFASGGDSIVAMRVVALATRVGLDLSTRLIFAHPTIRALSVHVSRNETTGRAPEPVDPMSSLPLTPIQSDFIRAHGLEAHHYNQAVLLCVPTELDVETLRRAGAQVAGMYDALRLRFFEDDGAPVQRVGVDCEIPVVEALITAEQLAVTIEAAQGSLDLRKGPVFRIDLIRVTDTGETRLLLTSHHLVIDAVSWGSVVEALREATINPRARPVLFGTSWSEWVRASVVWAASGARARAEAYWQEQSGFRSTRLPCDQTAPSLPDIVLHAADHVEILSASRTRQLLGSAPLSLGVRLTDILLASLALVICEHMDSETMVIDLEGHGRAAISDGIDVSATVGWFTAEYPVVLTPGQGRNLDEMVRRIRAQLEMAPDEGRGFGWLPATLRDAVPPRDILFNYLGQTDLVFVEADGWREAPESTGSGRSAESRRTHPIEINAFVKDDTLHVHWEYAAGRFAATTIAQLALGHLDALNRILDAAHERQRPLRAADVPLAGLNSAELEVVSAQAGDNGLIDVYPLTPVQGGMLFHTLAEPDRGTYLSTLACTLEGALDTERFQAAWQRVIERHDALRASIHWENLPHPVQAIRIEARPAWQIEDLSGRSDAEIAAFLDAHLETDRAIPFDLGRAPLMRMALFRIGPDQHRFVWTQHHIIFDGWSSAILLDEVRTFYAAVPDGTLRTLPQPVPFREHVAALLGQDAAANRAFWAQTLKDVPWPRPLLLHAPATPDGTGHAERERLLDAARTASLMACARACGVSLGTVLQGAWATLLGHYGDTDDVTYGVVVSGRSGSVPAADRMVGLFINTVPLRVRIENLPLRGWMRGIGQALAEAEAHGGLPLNEIQRSAGLRPDQPLFETLVIFQNAPAEEEASGGRGYRVSDLHVADPNNFPLTLLVTPGERLSVRILYDRGRFVDTLVIDRLLGHLLTLLEGIVRMPDASPRTLSLLTDAERTDQDAWRGVARPLPAGATLAGCIRDIARQMPDAIALRCGGDSLSYAELDCRAARIAGALEALLPQGAAREARIAIVLPRSMDMIALILGIWRVGAAYVPVDPAYPETRQRAIIAGASPALVVCSSSSGKDDVVSLETLQEGEVLEATYDRSEALAYVIFTSGSTGLPKGAMVEQRGMLNHVLAMANAAGVGVGTHVAQTASHCSDISVWQMFAGLAQGGCTVIYPDGVVLDPDGLAARMRVDRIAVAQFVPSYLAIFLDALEGAGDRPLPDLRCLSTIGETLHLQTARRWFSLCPQARLVNAYGPTEAADSVLHHVMTEAPSTGPLPIGRPIPNMSVTIEDRHGRVCPAWVPGEIIIAGVGVGRGYLHDPDRTKIAFRTEGVAGRAYRSGDVGYRTDDGVVMFLSRRDHQVKIRGFRVELGDIEAALLDVAGVSNAVAVLRDDGAGPRLCGYVAPVASDDPPSTETVRTALSDRLPAHMVPDWIAILPALPTTPNGKIDRTRLPTPSVTSSPDVLMVSNGDDPVRDIVAEAMATTLGLAGMAPDDDFFALGGHSLKAIALIGVLRRKLERPVAVGDVFAAPTPRLLRERLAERTEMARDAGRAAPEGALPVVAAQRRIWLASRAAETPGLYNMVGATRLPSGVKPGRLERALAALIARHEMLRTRYVFRRGELLQEIDPLAGNRVALGHEPEAGRLAQVIEREQSWRFDLGIGPMLRATLVGTPDDTSVLVLNVHHIAADAWSIRILTDDLMALYRGEVLPAITFGYRDHVVAGARTDEAGSGEEVSRRYWLEHLAEPLPRLTLPAMRNVPPETVGRGGFVDVVFSPERVEALRRRARAARTSLYSVVLAIAFGVMHGETGESDLVIGTTHSGRDDRLEGVVGVLVNPLALRMRVESEIRLDALIERTAVVVVGAQQHAAYPFDRLVEELSPLTPSGRFPFFDVELEYIPESTHVPTCNFEEVVLDEPVPKFALSFYIVEHDEALSLRLIHDEARIPKSHAQRIAERFDRLASALDEMPESSLSDHFPSAPSPATRPKIGLRLPRTTSTEPTDQGSFT